MIAEIVWLQYASRKCTIPRKEVRDKKMHPHLNRYILVFLCANTDSSCQYYKNISHVYT